MAERLTELMKNIGYTPRERLNVLAGAICTPLLHAEGVYLTTLNPNACLQKICTTKSHYKLLTNKININFQTEISIQS
jgi:hypothetical protein